MPSGIYIRSWTDGSLFNLQHLLTCMKTIQELITELLFAHDWDLLAEMKEALQHTVNHFSDEAKNFGLNISLKKTEVLYQPPPREAYSPPQISIDGTNLNAVEHFTYLGSIISNDATVSKDLDTRLSKASSSFGWLSKRVWQSLAPPLHKDPGKQSQYHSHPPVWCRDLDSLSEANQATGAVSPTLLVLHPWHQMARPCVQQRSPQESQPAHQRVHLASRAAALEWPHHKDGRRMHAQSRAGHITWMEDVHMPKAVFFSKLQEGKRDRGAPRKHHKDQLKRQLAQAGISHQSQQQETADQDSWRSSMRKTSCEFDAERHKAAKEKHRRQKGEQHPRHPHPKPSPVQSAVSGAHQESVSTATKKHARIDHQPS